MVFRIFQSDNHGQNSLRQIKSLIFYYLRSPFPPYSMLVMRQGRLSESSTLIKGGTGGKDAQQVTILEKINLSHNLCEYSIRRAFEPSSLEPSSLVFRASSPRASSLRALHFEPRALHFEPRAFEPRALHFEP